jgi:hypothetical protein
LNVQITILILVQAALCVDSRVACDGCASLMRATPAARAPCHLAGARCSCVGMAIGSVTWRRSHRGHWYFMWDQHTGNNVASDVLYGLLNFLTFWRVHASLLCLPASCHRRRGAATRRCCGWSAL